MFGQRFRLNAPKLGLVFQDGKEVAVEIPTGAEVLAIDSVPDPVLDPQQRVYVRWEERTITMFAVDIREGGEPILRSSPRTCPEKSPGSETAEKTEPGRLRKAAAHPIPNEERELIGPTPERAVQVPVTSFTCPVPTPPPLAWCVVLPVAARVPVPVQTPGSQRPASSADCGPCYCISLPPFAPPNYQQSGMDSPGKWAYV
jgi:hypothetical protein